MCGFSGLLVNSGSVDFNAILNNMGEAIKHRGPDSSGIWIDETSGVGFVHKRLAVVDISSAGHQPMTAHSGRYIICFNGEIYNHQSIRSELKNTGSSRAWQGQSDTETLLAAIDEWGIQPAVCRAVGMFAFALWDIQEKKLHLCRDRIGEKPLYYGWNCNKFIFSSELKSLTVLPSIDLKIDREALKLYFRHNYIPSPYSIYENIKKLEPGSIFTLNTISGSTEINYYWSAVDSALKGQETPFTGSFAEASIEVEHYLNESIRGQMLADVPVGAFLSGGIDSSTVVSLMQEQSTKPVNTFSIGFNQKHYNEAQYAKEVANTLGTNHIELYIGNKEIQTLIHNLPAITDEPFADSSLIPTYAVSKLAKEHVTVSLSGDGGDELFGGYSRYHSAASITSWRHRFGVTGNFIASSFVKSPALKQDIYGHHNWNPSGLGNLPGAKKLALALTALASKSDALAYRELISYWKLAPVNSQTNESPSTYFHDPDRWLSTKYGQESIQLMDVQTYLPDDILVKVDRAAMSVSLETRVPMLDHRLLEFIWSLPRSYRANSTSGSVKPLLKRIVHRHLPPNTFNRPKMGFGIPISTWLSGPLRQWCEELLDTHTLQAQGLLEADKIEKCWHEVLNGNKASAELIWPVLMFQHWMKTSNSAP